MRNKTFVIILSTLFLVAAFMIGASAQQGHIQPPEGIRQSIENKARELDLGRATYDIQQTRWNPGGIVAWWQPYERGTVFSVPGYGVLWISQAMEWAYRGDPFSRMSHTLGFPISNEFRCLTPDPHDRYQFFERGAIFWRATENKYVVAQDAPRPATPGDCAHRPGPTATVVTGPQVPAGQKPPQRHRYRISILGFTANRQTFDGYQELDGKGDEVYMAVQVTKFQSNGALVSNTGGRGALMGDTNQRPANEERMTLGNLSDDGGIGSGFTYLPVRNPRAHYSLPTLPWVVYEGDLTEGFDALTIIPSIWEWDGVNADFNWYEEGHFGLRPGGSPSFFYPVPYGRNNFPTGASPEQRGWITGLVSDSVRSRNGIAPTSVWGEGPILTYNGTPYPLLMSFGGGDLPIGMNRDRQFVPRTLFLTEQLARGVVTTNYPLPSVSISSGPNGITREQFASLGPGVIPVWYQGTDERSGDYTLYVKVEQLP